jgi:tetratricopeptide (TPR) repeat protein
MQLTRFIFFSALSLILFTAAPAKAQLGFDLDIKKPEPYENRELKAEKTGDKKLKFPKKQFQNATTHYNYFFNASTKLNEILERAKLAHKEDYTKLLPFYNYSLQTTTQDSAQLDSVINKSKTGIVLHDLRNDWIDNLYLLWGASYFLKQQFDSANQMFQFINYAFAEKEKDGYYRYIGSRMEGSDALSISTKEKDNIVNKVFSEPPARNDAFIWQARTMIQQGAYPEARSLIAILKNDPKFPERLHGALEELQALWFFKQEMWDSSAHHLVKALGEAKKGQERARWEYLAAQMFERSGNYELARTYYNKSIGHSTDPVMEVYARLNLIRSNKSADNLIDKNIADLLKMARKDKYEGYRDVIYSMAARMELERGNFTAAQDYLEKSSRYKSDNQTANNDAYLQLADLSFEKQQYKQAAVFYDSVKTPGMVQSDIDRVATRKQLLTSLLLYTGIIERQDSLQRIAAMPEEERTAFIKRLVKQLRKEKGLKDDASANTATFTSYDPFGTDNTKGEWYFYNETLKKKGAAAFLQTWGARPNVDNWRRQSDVTSQLRNRIPEKTGTVATSGSNPDEPPTFDVLMAGLPFTSEQIKSSNDSIQAALYQLGNVYMTEVDDIPATISTFENIRTRFDKPDSLASILFNLYYAYNRMGNTAKAAEIKRLLQSQFPNSRYTTILTTGVDPLSDKPSTVVTTAYEKIYDLYLEGKFAEAESGRKTADSLYKTNYWSPQLLYIEAVYQIRERQDSVAKKTLATLISQNAGTPLAAKAKNLLMVLSRRAQIEDELTKLQIERPKEDTVFVEPMPVAKQVEKKQEIAPKPKDSIGLVKKAPVKSVADSMVKKPLTVQPAGSPYVFDGNANHYVMVILTKVDVVFANEARNAFLKYNRESGNSNRDQAKIVPLTNDIRLLLLGNFNSAADAITYVQKVKPIAASQILPWLKGDKFTFSIITEKNLESLLNAKDLEAYQKFIDQSVPVKF